ARSEVYLTVGVNGMVFDETVPAKHTLRRRAVCVGDRWRRVRAAREMRQPVVPPLKGHPPSQPADPVPDSVRPCGVVVCVDLDSHGRKRKPSQVLQERIDVGGGTVGMVVRVDLAESGGLDVAIAEVCSRDAHLIDAASPSTRLEEEIALW